MLLFPYGVLHDTGHALLQSENVFELVGITVFFYSTDMANIVLLLVIIMLVFSVIGVTLYRDVVPMYFGNLSSCIFKLKCIIFILTQLFINVIILWGRRLEECFYFTLGKLLC